MSKKWLKELQEKVARCWEWHSPAVQIGFRFTEPTENEDFWEIWAYPAVQEIVGGKEDGETVWSGFNFDILQFLTDFEPEAVDITTRQDVHPYELTFEGKFRGQDIFLHLCLEPPEDAEATEILDISGDGGPIVRERNFARPVSAFQVRVCDFGRALRLRVVDPDAYSEPPPRP